MTRQVEYRHIPARELRVSEEGEFEGYASAFGVEDSAGSIMMPGAFRKTLSERSGKIKVLYNHKHLIGSPLEMREDNNGLFVRGRINTKTSVGRDVWELMKSGDLDGMSIAFTSMKETKSEKGVRELREVRLYEFGPVDFPANEAALITDVRDFMSLIERQEQLATDFGMTVEDQALTDGHMRLLNAIIRTLDDVWWSGQSADSIISMIDEALAQFHAAYLEWAGSYADKFLANSEAFAANDLALETRRAMDGKTPEQYAAVTALTAQEIEHLMRGEPIPDASRVPEPLRKTHSAIRAEQTEELFTRIRGSLSDAQKRRLLALLQPASEQLDSGLTKALNELKEVYARG